jgi:hypothetical protein
MLHVASGPGVEIIDTQDFVAALQRRSVNAGEPLCIGGKLSVIFDSTFLVV